MPSEDVNEKRISDLPLVTAQNVTEDTRVELSVEDQSSASGHSSYAGKLSTIIDKILNAFNFNTRLQTTNKTVFGAINEIAQGGGGGGSANLTELTQAEYDALEQAGELEEDMMYFITDGQSGGGVVIDDTTTASDKVWSSDKTDDEIQAVASDVATKQDDLTGGSLSNVDLDDYISNGNYWVTQTSVLNKPVTNFGYLEVLHCSSSIYMQMFTAFGADNTTVKGETYVRFYANSQWYGWNKIADSTPETVKVTRTNLTQNAGVSRFSFAAPAVTGYTRMVISANPSNSVIRLVRFEENGNNVDLFLNNESGSSVTYDITIAVAYIKS